MSKQLRAAFVSWLNPIVLVLGLFWLGCMAGALHEVTGTRTLRPCHPRIDVGWNQSFTTDALFKLHASEGLTALKARLADVEELRIDTRWIVETRVAMTEGNQVVEYTPPPGGLISLLPECKQLRRLSAEGMHFSPEYLPVIGSLEELEELNLTRCSFTAPNEDRPPVLATLKGMRGLRKLDLTGAQLLRQRWNPDWHLDEELQHLAGLPNLRTLILFDFDTVTPRTLSEVAALPQIETLAIDLMIGKGEGHVSSSDIAKLQTMSALRTVYVVSSRPYQNPVETCRAQLPGVTVRRGMYDQTRVNTCRIIMMALAATILAAAYQLACSLLCSVAPVTPRFRRVHLKCAAIIVGLSIAVATVILVAGRAQLLPALALNVYFAGAATLIFHAGVAASRRDVPGRLRIMTDIILTTGPLVVMMSVLALPEWYDAWLAGDWPILGLLTLAAFAVMCTRIPNAVRNAVRQSMERGGPAVAGFSDLIHAQQQRVQQVQQQRQAAGGIRIVDLPARLDATLQSLPVDRRKRQRTLLRAGCSLSPRAFVGFGGLLMLLTLCMTVGVAVAKGSLLDSSQFLRMAVMPICLMGLIPGLSIVADWRMRLTLAEVEWLRPVSRHSMRRLFFQSIALDMAPFVVLVCLTAAVLSLVSGYGLATLPIVILFAANGLLIYGAGMWIILIRRTWLAILVGIIVLLAWQLWTTVLLIGNALQSSVLLIPAAIAMVLGLATTSLAWNHWSRKELA